MSDTKIKRPYVFRTPGSHYWSVRVPPKGETRSTRAAKKALRIALTARDLTDKPVKVRYVTQRPEFWEFMTLNEYKPRWPLGYTPILPPRAEVGSHIKILSNHLTGHGLRVGDVVGVTLISGEDRLIAHGYQANDRMNMRDYTVATDEYALTD